jgi:prevent-host-death family protein
LKARQNLGTLLEEVYYRDDQFIIEHAGKPMAAVVPVWQLEEWQKHSSRQKKSTDAIKKTNVNRLRDDPERAYAALSLRMPHIPSMHLPLGSMHLPLNAATKTFAILAKRGAGKSNTGAVLAEAFHKHHIPFVVCDPIDVWGGLRLAHTGKDKGLPVVVFGRAHADIPLTCEMGREIAQAIVHEHISCVISTFGMPKMAQRQLIAEFAEEGVPVAGVWRRSSPRQGSDEYGDSGHTGTER